MLFLGVIAALQLFALPTKGNAIQIPLLSDPNPPTPLNASQIHEFKKWLPFYNAPYCMDGLSNWTCVPCTLFSIGTTNVTFLGKDDKTFGLVALHPPSKSLIISFRGTRNLDNWMKDLLFAKPNVPFPSAPDGAKVHYGFLKGYEQLQKGFRRKVARFRRAEPSFTIRFFGHSLGGALAILAAIDLMTSNHSLPLNQTIITTIGAPRIGNAVFAQWTQTLFPTQLTRLVNQDDLAPHLPPEFAGFLHGGREVWVKNGKGDTVDCGQASVSSTSSDAESTPELENPACSHSIKIGWDISKHGFLWDAWVGHHSCYSINGTASVPLDLVNEQ